MFAGFFSSSLSSIDRAASGLPVRQRASASLTTNASSAASVGAARSYQAAGDGKSSDAHREIGDADGDRGAAPGVGIFAGERDVVEQRLPRDGEVRAALGGIREVVEGQRIGRQLRRRLLQHAFGGLGVRREQQRAAEQRVRLARVLFGDGLLERLERLVQVDAIRSGLRRLEPDSAERDVGVPVRRIALGGVPRSVITARSDCPAFE